MCSSKVNAGGPKGTSLAIACVVTNSHEGRPLRLQVEAVLQHPLTNHLLLEFCMRPTGAEHGGAGVSSGVMNGGGVSGESWLPPPHAQQSSLGFHPRSSMAKSHHARFSQ